MIKNILIVFMIYIIGSLLIAKPDNIEILKQSIFSTKELIENGYNRYMVWPLSGRITSMYGWRRGRHHDGIDIAARMGKPIVAAANGTVVFSGWRSGYGRMVVVQHNRWLKTVYGHTSRNYVRRGEKVTQGQVIALVGSTGRSTGPHLHFEVRNAIGAQDPMRYLA